MILESIAVVFCVLVLSLIGIGPALWIMVSSERPLTFAAGIAPVIGYAVIGLISFPLVRYIGPAHIWAWPVTIGLVIVSLLLVGCDWQRHRQDYTKPFVSLSLLHAGLILTGCLILGLPMAFMGLQYAVFRTNPSDAFNYMSLAETLRVVGWEVLLGGATISPDNLNGLRALAAASPTALLTSRFVMLPVALNKMAFFAWGMEITSIPVYRFYYAHHLLALAVALPVAVLIGHQLRLMRPFKYLGATAIVFGFWAQFVLDTDAGFETSILPVVLLVIFTWLQLEQEPLQLTSRYRALLALAFAVIVCFYLPLASIIAVAFSCYYGLGVLQKTLSVKHILYHGGTLGLAILLLLLSGQLDFLFKNAVYLGLNVGGEQRFVPVVFNLIKTSGIAALYGLPEAVWIPLPRLVEGLAKLTASGIAMFLTLALISTGTFVALRSAPKPERIVFSILAAGLILAVVAGAAGNYRASGKAFTYVYPYMTFGILLFPKYMKQLFQPLLQKFTLALLGVWLVAQSVMVLYLPATHVLDGVLVPPAKNENFDLGPIVGYLDTHPPRMLLVTIPRAQIWSDTNPAWGQETWDFAYYSMLVFKKYPVYFQSGIIVDNSLQAQNMWLQSLTVSPDYAVILKSVDYIGSKRLGTKVAETAELILYKLDSVDLSLLKDQERILFRQRESESDCYRGLCVEP